MLECLPNIIVHEIFIFCQNLYNAQKEALGNPWSILYTFWAASIKNPPKHFGLLIYRSVSLPNCVISRINILLFLKMQISSTNFLKENGANQSKDTPTKQENLRTTLPTHTLHKFPFLFYINRKTQPYLQNVM